jgi:hypothetical protein
MVSHQVIGLTRLNMKVDLNANTVSYNSYILSAQSQNIKLIFKIKYKEYWLNAPRLALIQS